MIKENCIIYGGGKLGLYLTVCLIEKGTPPLFVWDRNANGDLVIEAFVDVKFPDFTEDFVRDHYNDLVVICLADEQSRRGVTISLQDAGFKNLQQISSLDEVFSHFDNEIKLKVNKRLAWITKESARSYEINTSNNLWSEAVIFPLYTRCLPYGGDILDVGTGGGRLALYLSQKGYNVTGFDISCEQLYYLKKKDARINVKVGDAKALPFENNSFDGITSLTFLQHFENWMELLAEQIRVCCSGGTIAFDFGFKEHYLYAQAMLGKKDIEYYVSSGYSCTDDINNYDPDNGMDYLATTTYKDLSDFCFSNNCSVESIMPHSFFVTNAFIEGSMLRKDVDMYEMYLRSMELEKNKKTVDVLTAYENNFISRLPYWFTRRSIVVLKKK